MNQTKLTILHWNDMHAHFDHLASQTKWLLQRRRDLEAQGHLVWAMDLGDMADRYHPLVEATECKCVVDLLHEMQTDFITIGNNEGLGNPHALLEELYDQARFPVLLANLFDLETGLRPSFCQPHVIKQVGGLRLGLTGLTAPFPDSYVPNNWDVKDPFLVFQDLLHDVGDQVDAWIILSHLGLDQDQLMAPQFPQVKLILGAHTHHILPQGQVLGETLLTGGGKYGQYIGETTLSIGQEGISDLRTRLYGVEDFVQDSLLDQAHAEHLWQTGLNLLAKDRLRALTPEEIQDPLSLLAQGMLSQTGAQLAIVYTGLIVEPLRQGQVSLADLHQSLPHPIHLNLCRMAKIDFLAFLDHLRAEQARLVDLPIRGRGFRGQHFGHFRLYGPQGYLADWDQVAFDLANQGEVLFVCPDHLKFVRDFPEIGEKGDNQIVYPYVLRNIFANELMKRR